jgi:hypothetical protein
MWASRQVCGICTGTYTLKHVIPAKQRMEGVGRQVRDGCGDGWGCAASRPGERQVSCRYVGNEMTLASMDVPQPAYVYGLLVLGEFLLKWGLRKAS